MQVFHLFLCILHVYYNMPILIFLDSLVQGNLGYDKFLGCISFLFLERSIPLCFVYQSHFLLPLCPALLIPIQCHALLVLAGRQSFPDSTECFTESDSPA